MTINLLTTYILVWPIISLAVLGIIVSATLRDYLRAKNTGQDVV